MEKGNHSTVKRVHQTKTYRSALPKKVEFLDFNFLPIDNRVKAKERAAASYGKTSASDRAVPEVAHILRSAEEEEEDEMAEGVSEVVDMGTHTVAVTHLTDGLQKKVTSKLWVFHTMHLLRLALHFLRATRLFNKGYAHEGLHSSLTTLPRQWGSVDKAEKPLQQT